MSIAGKEQLVRGKSFAMAVIGLMVLLVGSLFAVPGSSAAGNLTGIKVCLDPGHGGTDPGAVNGALFESYINLDVSFGLKHLLEGEGAEVVMTRTDDSYKTNADRYTFCNEESATILVSVHTNSVADPTWDGSMALYAPSREPDLARAIHEVMYLFLRDTAPKEIEEFRDFGVSNFASGVLFKCDMPAAMMEPVFMSHPAEAELLFQTIYDSETGVLSEGCSDLTCRRAEIAEAIYLGVLNYLIPGPDEVMHIAAVDMGYQARGRNAFVYTQVAIQDSDGEPVPGASVTIALTKPDGLVLEDASVTGDDGTVTIKSKASLSGEYVSTVTAVSKDGWEYNPSANVENGETLTVP